MYTPSIAIRTYGPADYPGCMAVFASNVPDFFAAAESPEFASYLGSSSTRYLVAELDRHLVGCGGWEVTENGQERLCWGMVHRDHHHRAIGTTLLRARLAALSQREDVRTVGIDTSQHTAPFFHRFGFRELSRVPDGFAPGLDLVRMQLAGLQRLHSECRP